MLVYQRVSSWIMKHWNHFTVNHSMSGKMDGQNPMPLMLRWGCVCVYLLLYPSVWSFGPPRNSILALTVSVRNNQSLGILQGFRRNFLEWKVITSDHRPKHANTRPQLRWLKLQDVFPCLQIDGSGKGAATSWALVDRVGRVGRVGRPVCLSNAQVWDLDIPGLSRMTYYPPVNQTWLAGKSTTNGHECENHL